MTAEAEIKKNCDKPNKQDDSAKESACKLVQEIENKDIKAVNDKTPAKSNEVPQLTLVDNKSDKQSSGKADANVSEKDSQTKQAKSDPLYEQIKEAISKAPDNYKVTSGDGYFQVLKRVHKELADEELVRVARKIREDMGNRTVLYENEHLLAEKKQNTQPSEPKDSSQTKATDATSDPDKSVNTQTPGDKQTLAPTAKSEQTPEGNYNSPENKPPQLPADSPLNFNVDSNNSTAITEQATTTNTQASQFDSTAEARRIEKTLVDHQSFGPTIRSDENCEKDLRDTISTLNSSQISQLEQSYQTETGKELKATLLEGADLSKDTKAAIEIYLKGSDKRTTEDTIKLAELATKAGNLEMFEEAFRETTPETREHYIKHDGLKKIEQAFGGLGSSNQLEQASDYLKNGHLMLNTAIKLNSSWAGDNEQAIDVIAGNLTQAERDNFKEGKELARQLAEAPDNSIALTAAQEQSLQYYKDIKEALEDVGNEREVADWQAKLATKGGGLISQIARHGGKLDDNLDEYLSTLEEMSQEDWQQLKSNPGYKSDVEKMLAIDLSESEMKRAQELLTKKMAAETFEEAKINGRRSVIDAVDDYSGFFNDDEAKIIDSLKHMTAAERAEYKSNAKFKEELDDHADSSLDSGKEQAAAKAILDGGNAPAASHLTAKLYMHAENSNIDEAAVISDIEEALRQTPGLKESLTNPQTEEEKKLAQDFEKAAKAALDQDEIEDYLKPLLTSGYVPLSARAELYKSLYNDDEEGFFQSLEGSGRQDWKDIVDKPDLVLSFLSKDEREVAVNIAKQEGIIAPEDSLRIAMLGAGTNVTRIKEVLADLQPEQIEKTKALYQHKYGSLLNDDLDAELSGQDESDILWSTRQQPQTAREAFNQSRDEVYKSADGLGKLFVSNLWDGSAELTNDKLNRYAGAMTQESRAGLELPEEVQKQFTKSLNEALNLYKQSEAGAADAVVNTAVTAAGIGAAGFTGGVSLSLLGYVATGGAIVKVGTKSTLQGSDYDLLSAKAIQDASTGAVSAASLVFGPAQLARMLNMGDDAAATATTGILDKVDDLAQESGKHLLKEGSQETLKENLHTQVIQAIANGSDKVNDQALLAIAQKVAANSDDVVPVKELISQKLTEAIQNETANSLKTTLRQTALNSASGGSSGVATGGVDGANNWDAGAGISKNFSQIGQQALAGGLSSATMAGGFTAAFRPLSKGLQRAQNEGPTYHNIDLDSAHNTGGLKKTSGNSKTNSDNASDSAALDKSSGKSSSAAGNDLNLQALDTQTPNANELNVSISLSGKNPEQVAKFKEAIEAKISQDPQLQALIMVKDGQWQVKSLTDAYEVQKKLDLLKQELAPNQPLSVGIRANQSFDEVNAPAHNQVASDSKQNSAESLDFDKERPVYQRVIDNFRHRLTPTESNYSIKIGNEQIKLDRPITVGREESNYIHFGESQVSARHLQIEMTANGPMVRDLNSTNGTFVNGQNIGKGASQMLRPGDRISLSAEGPEFVLDHNQLAALNNKSVEAKTKALSGDKPKENFLARSANKPEAVEQQQQQQLIIDGRPIPITQNKILLGRDTEANIKFSDTNVSRNHASIEQTSQGYLLKDLNSTHGTRVNGRPVPTDGVLLRPGDRIELGKSKEIIFGEKVIPIKQPVVVEYHSGPHLKNSVGNPEAVRQSNRTIRDGEIREPLVDGFQSPVFSLNSKIRADGSLSRFPNPLNLNVVVDRQQDEVLLATIAEAHRRFDQFKNDPKRLADELTKFTKEKMLPAGWTEKMADSADASFAFKHRGEQVLLGNYIARSANGEGAGVCHTQGMLFKVLGDDFGLDVSLITGWYGKVGIPAKIVGSNHVWNEVHIEGQRYVYDPRGQIMHYKPSELPKHNPQRDFYSPRSTRIGKYNEAGVEPDSYVTYEGSPNWRVSNETSKHQGQIVLRHDGYVTMPAHELAQLNSGRQLIIGESYDVTRSDGSHDLGWIYQGKTKDGQIKLFKKDAIAREVSPATLAKQRRSA
jgi:pSer/pThr/pTyr-binding forkhead associated (FHA) protein